MPLVPYCDQCEVKIVEVAPGTNSVSHWEMKTKMGVVFVFCSSKCLIMYALCYGER